MVLAFYNAKGNSYPVLICDTCGKPIRDTQKAIVLSDGLLDEKPIEHVKGIFHKGQCDPGKEVYRYSTELSQYMRQLVYNLHIGKKVLSGSTRQLVIDLPEPDDVLEVVSKQPW